MNYTFSRIALAGFIVGTLDITAAYVFVLINTGQSHFLNILRFISGGIYGAASKTGGVGLILLGLFLHYFIAYSFTLFFFWLYPKIKSVFRNQIFIGILYGTFIWIVMNLIVVPLSRIPHRSFTFSNVFINLCILIVCIGIPLTLIAGSTEAFKKIPLA